MSFGIAISDNGATALEVVDKFARYHSLHTGTIAKDQTINIPITGMVNDNTWACFINYKEITVVKNTGSVDITCNWILVLGATTLNYELTVVRTG